ncbi:MAG: HAD family phosphatase [Chloroflexi bacterium]|nr:HAD family phosphatase [Chloroflexota bacterium]
MDESPESPAASPDDPLGRVRLIDLPDPSAVIFDLDGTLVDTVRTRIDAWLDTFEQVGIPADRRHVAGLIGADGRRLANEVAGVAGRTLSSDKAEAIDRLAGERYGTLNRDPRPLPGARELLTALEAGDLPWAIATSSRAEQVDASVRALRLPGPPPIVDGSHVAQAKPAPDLLLLAAERLSVPARGCWYVGDATWDMRAARAATMAGIGVPSGAVDRAALESAGATVAVTSLAELAAELARRGLIAG